MGGPSYRETRVSGEQVIITTRDWDGVGSPDYDSLILSIEAGYRLRDELEASLLVAKQNREDNRQAQQTKIKSEIETLQKRLAELNAELEKSDT